MSAPEALLITVSIVPGSGTPPKWQFHVEHEGVVAAHMSGPRILVLESLARWVELFAQESAPIDPRERKP